MTITPRPIPHAQLKKLSRGGAVVRTRTANFQIGVPAETVKDTMGTTYVPHVYVIDPATMVRPSTGQTGEFEFPMYWGFFQRSGLTEPTQFATLPHAVAHVDKILKTSYLGPQWPTFSNRHIAQEYPQGAETPGFPDMEAELAHWTSFPIDKLRTIHTIGPDGLIFKGARILHLGQSRYRFWDGDDYLGDIDVADTIVHPLANVDDAKYYDPRFQALRYRVVYAGEPMVIPIHGSDGFDPKGGTSSLMLWNNGRVIFVDPPADILRFLHSNQIPIEAIDGVILTHVHGDHDPGTLQILTAARKAKLYTTKSIQRMYIDKLEAHSLKKYPRKQLGSLWAFEPLQMLTPMEINGLTMMFYHGFHANIAYGFNILDGQGTPVFGFSGDTLNDAKVFSLVETGVIASEIRAQHIYSLPFAAALAGGVSVHENGAEPLHTQAPRIHAAQNMVDLLGTGGRILAYHAAEATIAGNGLTVWGDGEGFANAIPLIGKVPHTPLPETERVRRLMLAIPVFSEVFARDLDDILKLGTLRTLYPGQTMMKEGEREASMYIVLDGELHVTRQGSDIDIKITNGLIGEGAFLGEPRNATVQVTKPTVVFELHRDRVHALLKNTGILDRLRHIRQMRTLAHQAIQKAQSLEYAHQMILDSLYLIADSVSYAPGDEIITQGNLGADVFLIVDGEVNVSVTPEDGGPEAVVATLGQGDVVGEMALLGRHGRTASVRGAGDQGVLLLRFPAHELRRVIDRYPTLRLRWMALAATRHPKQS